MRLHPVPAYFLRQALAYPKYLIGILLCVPIAVLLNTFMPAYILATVLARLSQASTMNGDIWSNFGLLLMSYVVVLFTSMAMWRLADYFMWRLEWSVQQKLAEQVFMHLVNESADFHANNFGGSLVSQSNKILSSYVRVADTTIFQTYPLIVSMIIIAVILAPRAPLFVVVLLVCSIAYLAFAIWLSRNVRKIGAIHAAAESKQTGYLADAITNIMVIKSYARRAYEMKRFNKATKETRAALKQFAKLHNKQMNILGTMSRTMSVLALVMAVVSVMVFNANIATVFLIFSYTSTLVEQLFGFSNGGLRSYNRAFSDGTDMIKILATRPTILDPENPEPSRITNGEITLTNVTFTHNGSDEALFNQLNLRIKHGEKVGLVGHSGSGKTTLTRLLLRFSDIDSGQITISGQDITAIKQDDLHEAISYVPQEPMLFHRTIAENIAYGKLDATQEEIEQSATFSHAKEFIDKLPEHYETLVGERGVKLSGGQRQRIAIARAMLKDAPILVLDEATSALDSESEVLIQDALWKLMEGRTAVVIAHRLSTIQKMDRIIVLDKGKIIEEGSHHSLLKKNGVYAKLWAHQSGGFIEE